jgi:hypothetical protein
MMHDELAAALDPTVYLSLDAAAGFEPEKRAKFHKACKDSGVTSVLDNTVSAAFGHQMVLSLAEGQHFDPVRRGRALAIAGRSAPVGDSGFSEALSRDSHLLTLQKMWPTLFLAMHGDHEIASTMVNNLWSAVTFIFTLRAARATHWNCQEVEDACRLQLNALPSYRSAVSNAAARLAAAYDAPENARQVNKNYAGFFLPFWWEHILLRGILRLLLSSIPLSTKRFWTNCTPPLCWRIRPRPLLRRRPPSRLCPPRPTHHLILMAGPPHSHIHRIWAWPSTHRRLRLHPTPHPFHLVPRHRILRRSLRPPRPGPRSHCSLARPSHHSYAATISASLSWELLASAPAPFPGPSLAGSTILLSARSAFIN